MYIYTCRPSSFLSTCVSRTLDHPGAHNPSMDYFAHAQPGSKGNQTAQAEHKGNTAVASIKAGGKEAATTEGSTSVNTDDGLKLAMCSTLTQHTSLMASPSTFAHVSTRPCRKAQHVSQGPFALLVHLFGSLSTCVWSSHAPCVWCAGGVEAGPVCGAQPAGYGVAAGAQAGHSGERRRGLEWRGMRQLASQIGTACARGCAACMEGAWVAVRSREISHSILYGRSVHNPMIAPRSLCDA